MALRIRQRPQQSRPEHETMAGCPLILVLPKPKLPSALSRVTKERCSLSRGTRAKSSIDGNLQVHLRDVAE